MAVTFTRRAKVALLFCFMLLVGGGSFMALHGCTGMPDDDTADLPPDGGPEFNRLIHESSPYLLQHARNPVDWYPWGEEAFEKAKREDKPIFLSIGYSTCHWCHVMERESFENEEIAAILNKHFVSIKVDREERPDVDQVYMAVVQAMTGSGGWPMSLFLTPDRKPFFGGTYFPPKDRFGRAGFKTLLTRAADSWKNDRQMLVDHADQTVEYLLKQTPTEDATELGEATLRKGFSIVESQFDATFGGFGARRKFPRSHNLSFLLRYWKRSGNPKALEMVETTLDRIARGGIQDHLGGGFHRYSTDRKWLVPHFEKMLYDQALLARANLEAYQATGKEKYARVARQIFEYVLRDLLDEAGGFHSAEDADSEGEEGKFYVWTRKELVQALGEADATLFSQVYGVTEAGNYQDEASGERTGTNILHLQRPMAKRASELKMDVAALEKRLAPLRTKLLAVRSKRVRPLKDDKVLTDWNGLMISSLAFGGQVLGEERYTEAAARAAGFLLDRLQHDGRLLHRYRQGKAGIPAYLDDYAFLCLGLVDLYEATFEVRWLREAKRLGGDMVRLFWDEKGKGFHFTGTDGPKLIAPSKELYDGALPSGNSVAALVLLRLGRLTMDRPLEKMGEDTLHAFSGLIHERPDAYPFILMALDFSVGPSQEIVLAGDLDAPGMAAMRRELFRRFLPNKVVALHPTGRAGKAIEGLIPFIKSQTALDGKATAYVCRNYVCARPTADLKKLVKMLDADS